MCSVSTNIHSGFYSSRVAIGAVEWRSEELKDGQSDSLWYLFFLLCDAFESLEDLCLCLLCFGLPSLSSE